MNTAVSLIFYVWIRYRCWSTTSCMTSFNPWRYMSVSFRCWSQWAETRARTRLALRTRGSKSTQSEFSYREASGFHPVLQEGPVPLRLLIVTVTQQLQPTHSSLQEGCGTVERERWGVGPCRKQKMKLLLCDLYLDSFQSLFTCIRLKLTQVKERSWKYMALSSVERLSCGVFPHHCLNNCLFDQRGLRLHGASLREHCESYGPVLWPE